MMTLVTGLFVFLSFTSSVGSQPFLVSGDGPTSQTCPQDLSALRPQMEAVLASVSSPDFKKAILASLSASIPDAIRQADGINAQIAFLESEIAEQEQVKFYAEDIAREANGKFMESLKTCQRDEKGSYCTAVEQYYISSASILANRAFLDALKCYKEQGMR